MPKTHLLLRTGHKGTTLSAIVSRSQELKPPFPEYTLTINTSSSGTQLEISLIQKPLSVQKLVQNDEGFESDVDSISLLSSDESFTSSTCLVEDHVLKNRENDSANGSSSSESDNEYIGHLGGPWGPNRANLTPTNTETYPLSDILCYTDVNYPKILLFIIKDNVLVFNFDDLSVLQSFYTNFNTLKAVTNQRTYSRNCQNKFNLLQRTDNNGMTHIEISRDPTTKILMPESSDSNIISLNTPENYTRAPKIFLDDSKLYLSSEKTKFYPKSTLSKSTQDVSLKKVWKSAENILEPPKRPERKRRQKGRAPPPPNTPAHSTQASNQPLNIMKGQYIRVAVDQKKCNIIPTETKTNFQTFSSNIQTFTPNWNTLRTPQSPLILTTVGTNTPKQNGRQFQASKPLENKPKSEWANSVPRLLKKRSKSETRATNPPMAYRYIDTTTNKPSFTNTQTISNRLFGLSQKLKEFSIHTSKNFNFHEGGTTERRNSLGEMTYKVGSTDSSNLKSVIKKTDEKKNKNNEKKVTFSAYATVQVV